MFCKEPGNLVLKRKMKIKRWNSHLKIQTLSLDLSVFKISRKTMMRVWQDLVGYQYTSQNVHYCLFPVSLLQSRVLFQGFNYCSLVYCFQFFFKLQTLFIIDSKTEET